VDFTEPNALMKILLAVDGSAYTHRMLAYLVAHDEWLGDRHDYHVLHVVLPVPHRAASFVGPETVRRFHEDDAETVLRPVRAFFELRRIPAQYHWHVGNRAEVIAHEATEGRYDLVMMGSHGHGQLANVVLGSVATQVLARCHTPVLIIR
jgi:nucleotide-binding universal stress UspA family protein